MAFEAIRKLFGKSSTSPSSDNDQPDAQSGGVIASLIEMKVIPAGEFLMGEDPARSVVHKKPQLRVKITKPFFLGVYPVTQEEYEQVVGSNPSDNRSNGRCPVENVSWHEVVAFCNALSLKERMKPFYNISGQTVSIVGGTGYRLPTEAEWEYACRAGTTTNWFFSEDGRQAELYAWCKANSGDNTHPVGQLKPNPWGLYDIVGNVREYCLEFTGADPTGPTSGVVPVERGGAFGAGLIDLLSTRRMFCGSIERSCGTGFRVARTCP